MTKLKQEHPPRPQGHQIPPLVMPSTIPSAEHVFDFSDESALNFPQQSNAPTAPQLTVFHSSQSVSPISPAQVTPFAFTSALQQTFPQEPMTLPPHMQMQPHGMQIHPHGFQMQQHGMQMLPHQSHVPASMNLHHPMPMVAPIYHYPVHHQFTTPSPTLPEPAPTTPGCEAAGWRSDENGQLRYFPARRKRSNRKQNLSKDESLARNREAASKSRLKKKVWTENLEENQRAEAAQRTGLHAEVARLRAERDELIALCLQHDNCECEAIREYLLNRQPFRSYIDNGRGLSNGQPPAAGVAHASPVETSTLPAQGWSQGASMSQGPVTPSENARVWSEQQQTAQNELPATSMPANDISTSVVPTLEKRHDSAIDPSLYSASSPSGTTQNGSEDVTKADLGDDNLDNSFVLVDRTAEPNKLDDLDRTNVPTTEEYPELVPELDFGAFLVDMDHLNNWDVPADAPAEDF